MGNNIHRKDSASGEGSHHWWHQRLTAIANLILIPWFMVSMALIANGYYVSVEDWLKTPFNTIAIILLLSNVFYHGTLGIKVVIEDYIHCKCGKTALIIGLNFAAIFAAAASIFAVLNIYFNI